MEYINRDFAKVMPVAEEIDNRQRAYSALAAPFVGYLALEGAKQLGLDLTPIVDTVHYAGAAIGSLAVGYLIARVSQDIPNSFSEKLPEPRTSIRRDSHVPEYVCTPAARRASLSEWH